MLSQNKEPATIKLELMSGIDVNKNMQIANSYQLLSANLICDSFQCQTLNDYYYMGQLVDFGIFTNLEYEDQSAKLFLAVVKLNNFYLNI